MNKTTEQLCKLADKFEKKLMKYAQTVSQYNTSELFFGSEQKQVEFHNQVQDPKSLVNKALNVYSAQHNNGDCSFELWAKILYENQDDPTTKIIGAKWDLQVDPQDMSLKTAVEMALKQIFRTVTGLDWATQEKKASKTAAENQVGRTTKITELK
jgi:hypothetical protein